MVIAGEPSGDALAAGLVQALRVLPTGSALKFCGAGGPKMAEAGVELAFDLTQHSVIGLWEVLKHYAHFKRLFDQLLAYASERRPDVIVCVDFSGFNRRFASAVRKRVQAGGAAMAGWHPRIVQFVSPQVWASRPGRAKSMARDLDLLLAIFPFEQAWYAERWPAFPVEFVGHPMLDRLQVERAAVAGKQMILSVPRVLLLPGSRVGELRRHWPVLLGAASRIAQERSVDFRAVLPNEALAGMARTAEFSALAERQRQAGHAFELQVGGLAGALAESTIALASTGTVTMECACLRVPTVTLYKTSWSTYQIARLIIQVKSLTMPNLLAGETVFPEFIQNAATPEALAGAALELLRDAARREAIRTALDKIIASLGGPGANVRAAAAIVKLMERPALPTQVARP